MGSAPSLGPLVSCQEVQLAIRYLLKMGGRYDWLFVTLSDREVQFGYLLVSRNVPYARVAPRRSPVASFIFRFPKFKRINDRSTNDRFGESALRGSCQIPVATRPGFLPFNPAVPLFFLPPHTTPASWTPIAFRQVTE